MKIAACFLDGAREPGPVMDAMTGAMHLFDHQVRGALPVPGGALGHVSPGLPAAVAGWARSEHGGNRLLIAGVPTVSGGTLASTLRDIVASDYRRAAAALSALDGVFAALFWDGAHGKLLVVTDPFGIQPVYMFRARRTLLVASELRAMCASGVVPVASDPAGWGQFFAVGNTMGDSTLLAGVSLRSPRDHPRVRAADGSAGLPHVLGVARAASRRHDARARAHRRDRRSPPGGRPPLRGALPFVDAPPQRGLRLAHPPLDPSARGSPQSRADSRARERGGWRRRPFRRPGCPAGRASACAGAHSPRLLLVGVLCGLPDPERGGDAEPLPLHRAAVGADRSRHARHLGWAVPRLQSERSRIPGRELRGLPPVQGARRGLAAVDRPGTRVRARTCTPPCGRDSWTGSAGSPPRTRTTPTASGGSPCAIVAVIALPRTR